MTPQEFFNHAEDLARNAGESVERAMEAYWSHEMGLAEAVGASFSFLEYTQPEDRTCSLCGHLCHTDETGRAPKWCDNPQCAEVRQFWNMPGLTTYSPSAATKRGSFLRTRW